MLFEMSFLCTFCTVIMQYQLFLQISEIKNSCKLLSSRYPITRDCLFYGLTILVLILVLLDEKVFWYESLVMLVFYTFYILIMVFNWRIEKWAHAAKKKVLKTHIIFSNNERISMKTNFFAVLHNNIITYLTTEASSYIAPYLLCSQHSHFHVNI